MEQNLALSYQITVKEYIEEDWSVWFDDLTITHATDGATVLYGAVRDQAALHGLIARVRDLGLTLISVAPYAPNVSKDLEE